jgi:hypothetical protein
MQPYVIKQGDYLAALAHQLGFDADTVWNDPSNAQLQQLRPNPNILFPGDVLQIPDPPAQPVAGTSLTPGSSNSFVSDAPTVTISVTFAGGDPTTYASKAYTIQELAGLTGLTTDGSGLVTFQALVTLQVATITFTESGESRQLSIGGTDPINTLSGIFKRLQNLGFIDPDADLDASDLSVLRSALYHFTLANGPPPSSSAAASSVPPPSVPGTPPAPALPDAPSSSPAPSSGVPAGAGDSAPPAADSAPPSEPPPSGPPSSGPYGPTGAQDNHGLSDNGTLDDATSQLLLSVHGS